MIKRAFFGAGCFWGVEERFSQLPGVLKTQVGYMGGDIETPTYEQVCGGATGHAETVLVEYDPAIITYDELLQFFWQIHDPTQINRQGYDVGTQYRSVIFYLDSDDKLKAEKARAEKEKELNKPIATTITEAKKFWLAEDYHQQYIKKTGRRVC